MTADGVFPVARSTRICLPRRLAAMALLLFVTTALGACGNATTYVNERYGFRIDHAKYLEEQGRWEGVSDADMQAFRISFLDAESAVKGDKTVNGVQVMAFELRGLVPLRTMKKRLEDGFRQAGVKTTGPIRPITINGIKGLRVDYTVRGLGATIKTVSYFLEYDKWEYQLRAQAVEGDWPRYEKDFMDALDSFRPV